MARAQVGSGWSATTTWPNGAVPQATDDVTIAAGQTVVLDGAAVAKSVVIESGGRLLCGSGTISLTTESVLVKGTLECGTANTPFLGAFTLTLTGLVANPSELGMGQKFLGVAAGGTLELHGRPQVSWTQLDQTAELGHSGIVVTDEVEWPVGAQLVIAAGRDQIDENEVVTVAAVGSDQRTIALVEPLTYPHAGETSTYSNGSDSWVLDERAEVGLLSRNIVIQGDGQSESNGVGGHLMTMMGAQARVSGVEFYRMGQRSTLRRYPFHWHLAGDVPGQYLRNSSIHRSYNRCAVIHGTSYAEVSDTVCYDFVGHGFFLEDGVEEHNVFDHDLAIGGHKPTPGEELLESDLMSLDAGNGPASFWLSNPNNTVTNSAAAGSEGTGYWYATQLAVTGDSIQAFPGFGAPAGRPWGTFENNRAHSMRQGFSSCRRGEAVPGMSTNGIEIIDLTTYHNEQNLWPCGATHYFSRAITASSPNGFQAPTPMVFEDSIFISYTDNLSRDGLHLSDNRWSGVRVYDQGLYFNRVHFVNFDSPNMGAFANGGGAFQRTMNRVENLTFDNSKYRWRQTPSPTFNHGLATDLVHDLDGSYTGTPGTAAVMPAPYLHDQNCFNPADLEFFGWVCPYRYALWRGQNFSYSGPLTMARSDGAFMTAQDYTGGTIENGLVRAAVPITAGYDMIVRYEDGMKHRSIDTTITDAFVGDSIVIEYLDTGELVTVVDGGPQVGSLAALRAATEPAWYRHDHSTFVKYFPTGTNWSATGEARLCFETACGNGSRSVDPPSVSIVTPAHEAQVSGAETITVTADIEDASGVAWAGVYVGNDKVAERTSPPWTFSVSSLPQGVHALKVVAQGIDGETFTALQQLAVDSTYPSISIDGSGLVPESVVVGPNGATATLEGAVDNFGFGVDASSDHVRLEINGVDQGIISGLPTTVPVVHGVNRYTLTLQRADGGQIASDTRVIYGMEADVIADFEDGVDARTTILGDPAAASVIRFSWGSEDPIISRADGQNDINHFDIYADTDNQTDEVRWELTLSPAQDWSSHQSIVIKQNSAVYDVAIVDSAGVETVLATGLSHFSTIDLPADPAMRSSIAALRMIFRDTDVPAGDTHSRAHLRHIELANPVPDTLGDVNCDTSVDSDDAMLILEFITQLRTGVATCDDYGQGLIVTGVADTNLDNAIDSLDAQIIQKCVEGKVHEPLCP